MPSEPDRHPLVLTKREQRKLAALDAEVLQIQHQKIILLREAARKRGIIAPNLEDLKSENGEPFVEVEPERWYRKAVVKKDYKFGTVVEEAAYLCRPMYAEMLPKGSLESCGWVKGKPVESEFDLIGPLSGSAGTDYYCKICRVQVGRYRGIVS